MAAEVGSQAPSVQGESGALPQPRQLQDSVDNPFVVRDTATAGQHADNDGGNDSSAPLRVPIPAGSNQPPPPAYTDAFRRPVVRGNARPIEGEASPLLSRHSRMSTVTGEREPTVGEHVRQQRGVARALLLWLGIGQWYSGLCIFCSFVFLTGGIVLITLSFLTLDKLQPVKLAVVASGIVFVLLSLLWPCGWLWNQWNKTCGCSYAPFVAYTWTLSLVYTTVVGALVFGVNEHYDCIHYCKNCTFEKSERYPCEFVQMSLWTMMTMMALMVVVVFVSFCYCCCGSSCKKDSGQGYTTL